MARKSGRKSSRRTRRARRTRRNNKSTRGGGTCPLCDGTGKLMVPSGPYGRVQEAVCGYCHGKGTV